MRMPWLNGMNLGVTEFDDDHRHIFEVLDALAASIAEGNLSGVRALFEELHATTLEHFREEEALMARFAYPGAAGHKVEHDRDRQFLLLLEGLVAAGRLDRLGDALGDYSAGYFRGVLRYDGMLARFLRQHGHGAPCLPCAPAEFHRSA